MIADLAPAPGGEAVAVAGLMGPGVAPHSYRVTRGDIAAGVIATVSGVLLGLAAWRAARARRQARQRGAAGVQGRVQARP